MMNKKIHILIVSEDSNICEELGNVSSQENYKVTAVRNGEIARKELNKMFYNIVFLDFEILIDFEKEFIKQIKDINEEIKIIILAGFVSFEKAIAVLNEGVFAYLRKPFDFEKVKLIIKKALKAQKFSLYNAKLLNRFREISLKDPLTGLYNYRYLRERLSSEYRRAKRYALPISIMMLDIDYFKSINDAYGHYYGDIILKEFAQFLSDSARVNDVVIRYGGEEFLIILSDTDRAGAVMFGERLLEILKIYIFDPEKGKIKLKVSIGISSFPENGIDSESEFIESVDQALREAKERGGNMFFVYGGVTKKNMSGLSTGNERRRIEELKSKLSKMRKRVTQSLLESIYAFAKAVENKDWYTAEHIESMVSLVSEIGKKMKLSEIEIESLKHAAVLHDLGKIGISDKILHKKGKLTKKEFEVIKKHPQVGAEIIKSINFLDSVVPLVSHHHERFDGLGYSSGMKGEAIPLGARIISVADTFQALTSNRPYRKAYSRKEAMRVIKEKSGTQFDPNVVKVFF